MALEVVLVVPVLMLLVLFVLWAGRGGRAGLIADLAAEEAATVAALGCEQGADRACEDLVGDVLSTRPGLDFLCIGGARPEGPDGLVQHRWVRFGATAAGVPEAAGVGLFGVGFVCETDGAVAPLRGVFPTVTFRGRGSEVAIEQGPPDVGISDAEATEGDDLEFTLSLDSPAVRDVTLVFSIVAVTDHTSVGTCSDSGAEDYEPPSPLTPLTVFVGQGAVEATITVPTCLDSVHEADEVIRLTLNLDSVPPLDPANPDGPKVIEFTDAEATGTIINDDTAPALTVTAEPERVREGSGSPLEFVVELPPVGRDVTFEWDARDSDLSGAAHTDPATIACPDADDNLGDPVDFIAQSGRHSFGASVLTQQFTVSVTVCDDFIGEPHEKIYLEWTDGGLGSGVAEGEIKDDEPRLAVIGSCTLEGIEEADACASEAARSLVFTVERTVDAAVLGDPPAVSFIYVTLPAADGAGRHFASAGGVDEALDPCNNDGALALKAGPHYDYVPQSGTETIPAGTAQTTVEVAVTVNDDALDEHNETFMLMLCRPSDIAFLADDTGLGVIVDDDAVTVAVSDGTATEPAREGETAELSFTVTLSAVTGREVRVGYHTDSVDRYQPPDAAPQDVGDLTATAGEDYTAVSSEPLRTLIFGAESDELTKTVTVAVLHDVLDEGDDDEASAETVALRLTATNADFADRSGSCEAGLVGNDCALGRIIDNDGPPAVTVTGPDQAIVEGGTAVFTVRLVDPDNLSDTMESGVEASVDYRVEHAGTPGAPARLTADGDDLQEPLSGTVEFAVGATEAEVEVGTVDDSIDEPDLETFQMVLVPGSALNAELAPTAASATAQIEDNDDGLYITLLDACAGSSQQGLPDAHGCADEDDPRMSFTVALVDADGNQRDADSDVYVSGSTVAVRYSTAQKASGDGAATGGAAGAAGVDYVTVDAGTVEIPAGDNSATFTVDLVNDDFHEGHEAFQVTIASDHAVLNESGEGVIVEDDPLPLVVVDDAWAVEGDDAVFAVRLIDPADSDKDPALQRPAYSSRAITVSYHTYGDADSPDLGADPGQDYVEVPQLAPASFTFPALSTAAVSPVRITTIPDELAETPERFQLRLAVGADVDYVNLHRSVAVGTISNDDDGLYITLIDACVGADQQVLPDAHACVAEDAADGMRFTVAFVDAEGRRRVGRIRYASDRDVTVRYSTAPKAPGGGAATGGAAGVDGVDYVTVDAGTVEIPAGDNSGEFYVQLVDDDFHEGHEAFHVTIESDHAVLVDSGGGVIVEDEPLPLVVVDDAWAVEGDDAVFAVRFIDPADRDKDPALQRPAYSSRAITVSYHTYGDADSPDLGADPGQDYVEVPQSAPASFTFPALSTAAVSPVRITTIPDEFAETPERFQLRLAVGADVDYVSLHRSVAVGTISNDGLYITLIDACVGADQQVLPDAHACVAEDAADGMRFTVAFVNAEGRRRVGRIRYASDRNVTVTYHTAPTATGGGAATGGAAGDAGVDYVTVDAGTVEIPAGDNSATFTVDLVDDDFPEGHEAFQVTIGSTDYDTLVGSGEGVIIEDDPLPLVVVDDAWAVEGNDAVFAVRLIDPADRDKDPADQRPAYSSRAITVSYHTYGDADSTGLGADPGQDYVEVPQLAPASFTFPALSSATAQPVGITTITDEVAETPEHFQLRLAFGADVDYASLHRNTAVGTISDVCIDLDDDQPDLAELTTAGVTVDEDEAPNNKYRVTVSTSLLFCEDVPITYSTSGGTGVAGATGGVDFEEVADGAGILPARSATVTLEGSILDDTLDEADEQFTVTVNWDTTEERMSPYRGVAAAASTVTIIDNDDPPVVAVVGPASVYEGATAQYQIRLVSRDDQGGSAIASGKEVSVKYYTCCGTATPGDDYDPVPQDRAVTLDFTPDRVTEHTVEIAAHTDDIPELGGEEFQLRLRDPDEADLGDANTVVAAIVDDVSVVSVSSPHALEGQTMRFYVSLDQDPADEVTVQYATEDLAGAVAATAGSDYTPVDSRDPNMAGNPLVFTPGGSLTRTVVVDLTQDSDDSEGSEIFRLRLLSADGAYLEHGDNTYGTGTIHDLPDCIDADIPWHPAPTLSVDESSFTITEGASVTNTVRLSRPFCDRQDVRLNYSIIHGNTNRDDFPEMQDMWVMPAVEPGSTTDGYVFETLDDDLHEDNENFRIRVGWSRETCIQYEQYCQPNLFSNVTINDNDEAPPESPDSSLPILIMRDVTLGRGELWGPQLDGALSFWAVLVDADGNEIPAPHEIRVNYTTRDLNATGRPACRLSGADYKSKSGQVVFDVGDSSRRISVDVCTTRERRITERLHLVLLSDPAPVGAVLGDPIGVGTMAGWWVATLDNWNSIATESGSFVRIWARVTGGSGLIDPGSASWVTEPCTPAPLVCVPATAGEDYVSASGTIEFKLSRRNVPIDIELMDDNVDELTEAFSMRLSDRSGDVMIHPANRVANVWIRDDDPPPALDFETTGLSVPEGTAFTFTVELEGTSDRPVTVDWVADSGGFSTATEHEDYLSGSGTLTFIPGQTTASFTVMTINDARAESNETFRVRLRNPSNALLARPGTFAVATIDDDDS